jgi:hypothetical protein
MAPQNSKDEETLPKISEGRSGGDPSGGQDSLAKEFLIFLRDNKLWWLTPMVLMAALLAAAVIFSPSPVAPFIYSLF